MNETISAKQLGRDGKSAYQQGDYLAAARAFEAAVAAHEAARETLLAAEARNNASVAYLLGGDAQAALRLTQGTAEIFAAAGDETREGMAWGNLGAALDALGNLPEAEQAYERSAGLLQQNGEQELYLHVMRSLSALQLRRGRQLEALDSMQAGLEGVQRPTPQQRLLKKLLKAPRRMLGK
jgi:tetratricopeptide (TPR) repeat protein